MRPVYGNKCFTRQTIYVWCQKFSRGRESVVDDEWPGRQVVVTTDSSIAAVDYFNDLDDMLNKKDGYRQQNVCQRQKLISIRIGCGFLFAFHSNSDRICSHFGDIQRQRMAWPWKQG